MIIKDNLHQENTRLLDTIDRQYSDYEALYQNFLTRKKEIDQLNSSKEYYKEVTSALSNKVKVLRQIKTKGKSRDRHLYVVISTEENKLWLKRGEKKLREFDVATGFKSVFYSQTSGVKRRLSITPKGVMKVRKLQKNPVWIKPDWAFKEKGLPVPPLNSPLRRDTRALGPFGIYLQKRYIIHGTYNKRDLGKNVSHGCIRMIKNDLEIVYNNVEVGTEVFIY